MGSYSDAGGRRVPQRKAKEGEHAQWIYAINRYAERAAYKKQCPEGFMCMHDGCESKLTASNWAAGGIFCFNHETQRGGLGFCKQGHDLFVVGATEIEKHCLKCIEEGTLQLKLVEVAEVSVPEDPKPVPLRPEKEVVVRGPWEQTSLFREQQEDQMEEIMGGTS